jgi:hypothetical protein
VVDLRRSAEKRPYEVTHPELLDRGAIDLLRPAPIKIDPGFGRADMPVSRAPLEAALLPLALLDGEYFSEPGLVDDLVAAADQPEQVERSGLQLRGCVRSVVMVAVFLQCVVGG